MEMWRLSLSQEKITIVKSGKNPKNRILIGTATLGIVRMEWAATRWGQIIPCNWTSGYAQIGLHTMIPMHYLVAEAQNICVQEVIDKNYEWLFFHEDDVMLPPDMFLKLNDYIRKGDTPIVSGLYYTKSNPSEPLVYRGRGNSFYDDWNRGDKVWVDGVPTGCLLIHSSILKALYDESEEYVALNKKVRKVFETPRKVWYDPETHKHEGAIGTSDLYFCDRIMDNDILKKAGWKKLARRKYPFLIDTTLFCKHIDLNSGKQYPQ